MGEGSLVSIIIPVYNTEKYLNKCVYSILDQSWKNIEIILVNDGSADNSKRICEMFAQSDHRVVVIDKENEGVSAARNAGIEKAHGKWVLFIDSDDYVDKDMVENLLVAAEDMGAEISICNFRMENAPNQSLKYPFGTPISDGVIESITAVQAMEAALLPDAYQTSVWGKLFSLEIIRDNEIRFNEKFIVWEDYDFFFSYMRFVNKAAYASKTLYTYIQREEAVSHKKVGRNIEDWKVKSRYYATKNAEKYIMSVTEDPILLASIRADRVETSAYMYLITEDPEKSRKYLSYVRNHYESFRAYCGLKNKAFNKVDRINKYPSMMKTFYKLRKKHRK